MALSMYRSQIAQSTRKEAELQKSISDQRSKIAKLQGDIASIRRGISRTTTGSNLNWKLRQIESKTKDLARAEGRLADLQHRQSSNLADLARYTQSRDRAESQEQRRQESETRRRQQAERQHTQSMTRELEHQSRLHREMRRSHMVIDLARLPDKITVLFLAANPRDLPSLGLDEEIRRVGRELRASEYRDSVALELRLAVRPTDLLQALNETTPQVVHFSGHGSEDGIALQNPDGSMRLVSKEAMANTLKTVSDVRVVIFNSCFSEGQAEVVTELIDIAIGMNAPIGDMAAQVFAGQFYSSIGFGLSVQRAFEQALAQMQLAGVAGKDIPQLYARVGIDPDDVVIVRPPYL